ncbi:hypothetical protein TWF679_008924 [Orbilia oligospora]|uniref:Serine protease n=1 Tax=Orbilia oligospora TaxID=2813651 RepID=A0A8H8VJW2_ORBOL|nr:hypothetical protein TWF679_008924 [Orbilia oligospora]
MPERGDRRLVKNLIDNSEDVVARQPTNLFTPFNNGFLFQPQPPWLPFKPLFKVGAEDQALLLSPGRSTEILHQSNATLPKDRINRYLKFLKTEFCGESEDQGLLRRFQNSIAMLAVRFSEAAGPGSPSVAAIHPQISRASGILIDNDKVLTCAHIIKSPDKGKWQYEIFCSLEPKSGRIDVQKLAEGNFPGSVAASVMAWNNSEDTTVALRKASMMQAEDIAVLGLVSPLAGGEPVGPISRKREWIRDENPRQDRAAILAFNTEPQRSDIQNYYLQPIENEELERGLGALAGGCLSAASSGDWFYGTKVSINTTRPTPHVHRRLIRDGFKDTIGYRISCTGGSSGGMIVVAGEFVGMHQGTIFDSYVGPKRNESKVTVYSLSRAIALDLPGINTFMRTKVLQYFNNKELRSRWEKCLEG